MRENYTYSDVDSGLRVTPSGNVQIKYDEEVIIQSIENIISTVFGEDVRSGIGSRLIVLLGRTITPDTARDIEDTLRQNILDFEPRVEINRIHVTPDTDNGLYQVDMTLQIRDIPKRLNFRRRLRAVGL